MPKDWNAAYENEDTPWDKGFAAPPLREFLERYPVAGRVLVPGCGAGHDVRLLAGQGADVLGLDVAAGAVRKAEQFLRAGNECYVAGDFLNLPTRYHDQFDFVVEHTCLCALDLEQRIAYVQAVKQALKSGGHYLAIFYREVKQVSDDGPPHSISTKEIEALFDADFTTIESSVPQIFYPSRPIGSEELRLMRKR